MSRQLDALTFAPPTTHVYNPLVYAAANYAAYCERFGTAPGRVILLGMNPGPFGMVQTGVPFGDVTMVRDWLGIAATVERPRSEHPSRPIEGMDCRRNEVSGTRLWGWARDRFGTPERFFTDFFVLNYCPLAFLEAGGKNRTPDKLPADERAALYRICDRALASSFDVLRPRLVVGIGSFAHDRAASVASELGIAVGTILHPSPASPRANRGWAEQAERELSELGIRLPRAPKTR